MSTRPYDLDIRRLPIAIGYKNDDYIADFVMPREPVPGQKFSWNLATTSDLYNIPETRMSRKGQPNEVEFTYTAQTSEVFDEGIDDVVPVTDEEFAPNGVDPGDRAVTGLSELLMLGREKRVADTVFNSASYDSSNVLTLSGTDQFDNAASDALGIIIDALDAPLVEPNTMVFGKIVWSKFRRNPTIVEAVRGAGYGNAAQKGVVNQEDVAMLFGVDRVLIGKSRGNGSKPGQTPVYSRLWGKSVALLHLSPLGGQQTVSPTWGWTAEYGTKIVRAIPEEKIGLKGSIRHRVGEQVREIVSAPGAGYLIAAAIS